MKKKSSKKKANPDALSVSELTRNIKQLVESSFGSLWVDGELSNFKVYASGHAYFTLKDENAQLSAVMWRSSAARLKFEPEDGMQVLVRGRLSVYEPRGNYQLVVERMEPSGIGELAAAFEALKLKLSAEGLFEPSRKKTLPTFPRRIAIVTSPSGAAIRDMVKVILGRWPRLEITLMPVRVQGDSAAKEIARGIEIVNELKCADVMIIGRGGGSMEDLWAFNEEVVARAIAASRIPIISAVGHEVDFTISDFVADVRAATPSHAGEIVVPELSMVSEQVRFMGRALPEALLRRMHLAREKLKGIQNSWAFKHPEQQLEIYRQRIDDLESRLDPLVKRKIEHTQWSLVQYAARLEALSPLKVLDRGYSVAMQVKDEKVVKNIADVKIGDQLSTRVKGGRIISKVEDIKHD